MRLIGLASLAFVGALAFAVSAGTPIVHGQPPTADTSGERRPTHMDGKSIFRFDTFGDEQLWTDTLRMHEVIATVDPLTALSVGIKG